MLTEYKLKKIAYTLEHPIFFCWSRTCKIAEKEIIFIKISNNFVVWIKSRLGVWWYLGIISLLYSSGGYSREKYKVLLDLLFWRRLWLTTTLLLCFICFSGFWRERLQEKKIRKKMRDLLSLVKERSEKTMVGHSTTKNLSFDAEKTWKRDEKIEMTSLSFCFELFKYFIRNKYVFTRKLNFSLFSTFRILLSIQTLYSFFYSFSLLFYFFLTCLLIQTVA